MDFVVAINEFEGPLDLMLHLIKEEELDLFDLDILTLVDQYIDYLRQMEALHLEIASEYLTMLASLIEYKSKLLLPKEVAELEGEYEEDPKELLVKRLLEYQRFKDVSQLLEARLSARMKEHSKPMESITEVWMRDVEVEALEGDVYDLVKAMNKVMQRVHLDNPFMTKVTEKEISVDDCVLKIHKNFGERKDAFSFYELVSESENMQVFVVSFLAVLDLIRLNVLNYQISESNEIYLKWSDVGE